MSKITCVSLKKLSQLGKVIKNKPQYLVNHVSGSQLKNNFFYSSRHTLKNKNNNFVPLRPATKSTYIHRSDCRKNISNAGHQVLVGNRTLQSPKTQKYLANNCKKTCNRGLW